MSVKFAGKLSHATKPCVNIWCTISTKETLSAKFVDLRPWIDPKWLGTWRVTQAKETMRLVALSLAVHKFLTNWFDFQCDICHKKFLYSYNVTAHIKHVHHHEKRPQTNEEKLICTVCGKVKKMKLRWFILIDCLQFQKFQKIWKVKEHMAEVHKIIETTEDEEGKLFYVHR